MRIVANESEKAVLIELGSRIRQYRIALNVTQAELAERCGFSPSTETRIENGDDTGISNYVKILSGLGLLENLNALIPEPQPDFKALYEQKPLRRRAKPGGKRPGGNWTWGEDR